MLLYNSIDNIYRLSLLQTISRKPTPLFWEGPPHLPPLEAALFAARTESRTPKPGRVQVL